MNALIDEIGGPSAVARMTGVKVPSVIGWRPGAIPAERCPAIELGTKGRFTCELLNTAVRWHRVSDSRWQWHPDGRPVVDVSAALLD